MTTRDMRRAPRTSGNLPVMLTNGSGITRDFNSLGVYFITNRLFIVNEPVDFSFTLSNLQGFSPVEVRCAGNVVRVESVENVFGVAVTLGSYSVVESLHAENFNSGNLAN